MAVLCHSHTLELEALLSALARLMLTLMLTVHESALDVFSYR
jgi:hypothetical protein